MANLRNRLQTILGNGPDRGRWGVDLVFWGCLIWATWMMVAPIWIGPMPPMTDFGGHAAMLDVWARLDDVQLYHQVYVRRTGLVPNTLAAGFVGVLYPLVAPLAATRLFTALCLVATVAALLMCLKVFDRSRWLIFLCVPFLWNGSFFWGMVNFIPTIPLFFFALALARRAGQTGRWPWAAGVAAVGMTSFFAHGLGCIFVVSASCFVWLLSIERRQTWWQAVAWAPATALWIHWRTATAGGNGLPSASITDMLANNTRWWQPDKALREVIRYVLDVTTAQQDTVYALIFGLVWLVLMSVSLGADTSGARADGDADRPHAPQADDGHWSRIKSWIFQRATTLYGQANRHCLTLVVVCLALAVAFSPAYIKNTNVKTRFVPFLVFAVAMLPRLPRQNWLAQTALTTAFVTTLSWGGYLADKTRRFERREMQPIADLATHIPDQSRVECSTGRPMPPPVFWYFPVDHNCPGLLQVATSSMAGSYFPATAFNPVTYRDGQGYTSLHRSRFSDIGRLRKWDYVVIRGQHHRPKSSLATMVATARADGAQNAPTWTLYRVQKAR